METITIHGKQYVTVNERVKYFREQFKDWTLLTEVIQADEKIAIMKCTIKSLDGAVVSTGHAFEIKTGKGINSTSHIENCETSAVGRALGFMGIGIDGGIASLDEILNASTSQYIQKLLLSSSVSSEDREKIEDNLLTMTTSDAQRAIKFLNAHQLDPVTQGENYSPTDIQHKLDNIEKDERK